MLIKRKAQLAALVLVLILVGNVVLIETLLWKQTNSVKVLDEISGHLDSKKGDVALFAQKATAVKLHVVQVQQFLSDVSATRAQDGLGDGFDMAAEHAADFRQLMTEMREIIVATGDKDGVAAKIDAASAAFETYFTVGNQMAKAYVEGGPELGNKMMPEFDDASLSIQERTEELLKISRDRMEKYDQEGDGQLAIILASSHQITQITMVTGGIIVLLTMLGSYYLSRRVMSPLFTISEQMGKMAEGNLDLQVGGSHLPNEIGMLARAFATLREGLKKARSLEEEQAALKIKAELDKKEAMRQLADDFDRRTATVIKALVTSSTDIKATASRMSSAAAGTTQASQIVSSAAAEADSNVQTVAAATEELSASSSEISRQISGVAEKSGRASTEAEKTNRQVTELNELADSIGAVVGAIKEIAEQTNLLALNATIEAARAGEAGKGFAVVADEVKKLANETAEKTIQIDERVVRIQHAIRGTVDAVQRIIADVREIDEATGTVASAVEQQNAATSEIGRNVAEASSGTQRVAFNISEVHKNAENTTEAAGHLNGAAQELSDISDSLQREVSGFLDEIRRG